jgi:acyl carrier protein
MALPEGLLDYLNETAASNGAEMPGPQDDLFQAGVLDSFALVDFITALEEHCGLSVPDSDINPANFRTLEDIENYISSRQ